MGILGKILLTVGAAAVGIGIAKKATRKKSNTPKRTPVPTSDEHKKEADRVKEKIRKEEERKSLTPIFKAPITKEVFERIAIKTAKPIKRLYVTVEDQFITGNVTASSGISTWSFQLDYNDFGRITGNYWISYCENYDSSIPGLYAEQVKEAINYEILNYSVPCPYCGANLFKQGDFDPDSEFYECDSCKKAWHNGDWYCENCKANLNEQEGFSSFDWDYFKCQRCNHIFFNAEFTCPYCNAVLNDQENFSPEYNFHKCTECGKTIYTSEDTVYSGETFVDTYWHCDRCNSLLNIQDGFTDTCGNWECKRCGYVNIISREHISSSPTEEPYRCGICGEIIARDSKFCPVCGSKTKDDDTYTCTECGKSNRREYAYCIFCGHKKV